VVKAYDGRGVEVRSAMPVRGVIVHGHPILLEVFRNVLDNAVRYDKHEHVEVEVSCVRSDDGAWWSVQVCDAGPGLPEDMRRSFHDAPESGRRPHRAGLGLLLVREVVGRLGGRVRAEPREPSDPSRGTRVVIELRLAGEGPVPGYA